MERKAQKEENAFIRSVKTKLGWVIILAFSNSAFDAL